MENPIKMDDLGVPLFSETSKYGMLSGISSISPWHVATPLRLLRSVSESGSTALFDGATVLAKNAQVPSREAREIPRRKYGKFM